MTLSGWLVLAAAAVAAPPVVEVTVDPRVELLSVVQLLAGYEKTGLITRFDLTMKREVEERFGRFREDPVVKLFQEQWPRGFSYDAPPTAVLHLGGPPGFALVAEPDEELCGRAGGRGRLLHFFQGLRDFAKASDFVKFFEEQKELHAALVEEARTSMAGMDVGMLEAWYGVKQRGYHIVLAPLLHPGGFGPRIPAADGRLDIFGVIGPQSAKAGRPGFGRPEDFRYLIWHEFSHSFVNPVVDRNGAAVDRCESLFEPLRKKMKAQAYGDWRTCVYEHVVRAATIRFSFREDGPAAGKKSLDHERGRGFAHVEALARELERYEQDRARWPAFADFFGELLKVFERAAGEKPPEPAARVVRTIPEAGNLKVDPALVELRVEFDRDMSQESFSWVQQSAETFPKTTGKPRWLSPRVCVLPVQLEPGRDYWVGINGGRFQGFRDLAGRPAEEHPLPFRTRGK